MLSDTAITVLANSAVSLAPVLATGLISYLRFFGERKTKRIELYASHRQAVFRDFIAGYSGLYMSPYTDSRREFLTAWRAALSVADGELFDTLSELSGMASAEDFKPSPESDRIFFRCVRLINDDFNRNIGRRL